MAQCYCVILSRGSVASSDCVPAWLWSLSVPVGPAPFRFVPDSSRGFARWGVLHQSLPRIWRRERPKNEYVKSNFQAPHIMVISIKRKGKARRSVSAMAEAALPQASETDSPRSSSFRFRGLGSWPPSVFVSVARDGTQVRAGKSSPCCLSLIPRLSSDSSSAFWFSHSTRGTVTNGAVRLLG